MWSVYLFLMLRSMHINNRLFMLWDLNFKFQSPESPPPCSHTYQTQGLEVNIYNMPPWIHLLLALVMHSNEGGPGPRYNMKEDPGSSTLIMLKEYGCHLYLMPRFSESGDNRNRRMGLPPSSGQPGQSPLPPPSGTYSTPCQSVGWGQPRKKSHFSLWFEVRGHGLGKRRMWRPFWTFQHFSTRSDSRASDQHRLTSALLYSATL